VIRLPGMRLTRAAQAGDNGQGRMTSEEATVAIKGEWIRFGEGSGYYARPDRTTGPLPGVLVIQEIMGVNRHIEDVTRRFAAAGYAALAPDLFATNGERPLALSNERVEEAFGFAATLPPGTMFDPASRQAALATLGEAQRGRIAESFAQVFSFAGQGRAESLMAPLRAGFRHLRGERGGTQGRRIGCVGFCMGGGLSALLACEEPELSGVAVFYGTAPPAGKIAGIACPVIAFYGSKDQRVNAGVPGFRDAMHAAGKSLDSHTYEGASHAFFNDDGPSYDANAARDSWTRLLGFFSKTLSG
jgi:carboxymethylenebutenolidase